MFFSTATTSDQVKQAQLDVSADKTYTKTSSGQLDRTQYVWNEKLNQKNGTDLRDVIVPKLINRLETVQEVATNEITDEQLLTQNVYSRHKEKNMSHNSSFTEDDYNCFQECGDKRYVLDSLKISIELDKRVCFYTYNEVGATAKSKSSSLVLPKRLIFDIRHPVKEPIPATFDQDFKEFCDANKIYKSDIRIINSVDNTTQVVSPVEFRNIIMSNTELWKRLSNTTQKALNNMIEACRQQSSNKQTNNVLYNTCVVNDCKCCNISQK